MSEDSKRVEIACELRHETGKALLIFDGTIEVWLPKLDWNGKEQLEQKLDGRGKLVAVVMPEALALKKGLFTEGSKTKDLFE